MSQNYQGVASNVSASAFSITEPIDGDAGNGGSVQTPYQKLADFAEYLLERVEMGALGPAVARTASLVTPNTSAAFGSGMLAFASTLGNIGRFCAVGMSAAATPIIQTSDDFGISWTTRTSNAGAHNLNAVAWNGSMFVAVGDAGTIVSSLDGITWVLQTSNITGNLMSIAYSPTLPLWMVSGNNASVTTTGNTATTGQTWTARATGLTIGGLGIFCAWNVGQSTFCAVTPVAATNAQVATSSNGTAWAIQTAPAQSLSNIAYANYPTNPVLIMNDASNNIWTSATGLTGSWTQRATALVLGGGFSGQFTPVFTGRTFIYVPNGTPSVSFSVLVVSKDGVTFTLRPLPFVQPVSGCVVGLAAVNGGLAYQFGNVAASGQFYLGPSFPFP